MTTPRSSNGFTLIEVMVAMAILLVSLLGLMRMHVIGISSNAGARMHTQASELAQELAQGLERLQPNDPRLDLTEGSGSTAPSTFGHLVAPDGSVNATTAIAWDDSNPVPGVRNTAEIPPGYTRRWTVWGYTPSTGAPGALLVAVSVVWGEPALPRPREVVVYTQVPQTAALMSGIATSE